MGKSLGAVGARLARALTLFRAVEEPEKRQPARQLYIRKQMGKGQCATLTDTNTDTDTDTPTHRHRHTQAHTRTHTHAPWSALIERPWDLSIHIAHIVDRYPRNLLG